jgi:hypothetical protein
MNNNKDENAKNPDFKVPMDLPSVTPGDYDVSIDSGHGSAGQQQPRGQSRRGQKERDQLPRHNEANGGA